MITYADRRPRQTSEWQWNPGLSPPWRRLTIRFSFAPTFNRGPIRSYIRPCSHLYLRTEHFVAAGPRDDAVTVASFRPHHLDVASRVIRWRGQQRAGRAVSSHIRFNRFRLLECFAVPVVGTRLASCEYVVSRCSRSTAYLTGAEGWPPCTARTTDGSASRPLIASSCSPRPSTRSARLARKGSSAASRQNANSGTRTYAKAPDATVMELSRALASRKRSEVYFVRGVSKFRTPRSTSFITA